MQSSVKVVGRINPSLLVDRRRRKTMRCPICHSGYSFGYCDCELEDELIYFGSFPVDNSKSIFDHNTDEDIAELMCE